MKRKLTMTLALAAVGCICWFCAGAQTTNSNDLHLTFRLGGTITNVVRVPAITNLVVEDGQLYAKPDSVIEKMLVTDEGRTNIVNTLIASGEFCRVRGHTWGNHMHVTLEYSESRIGCRECKICGVHQEKHATEWK